MSEYSSDFGQPAEIAPVLSLANAMLLSLTLFVITLACGLAAYVTNTETISRLQQAGYAAWSGASIWADLLHIPSPAIAPGSSVWYRIQTGGRLDFAFTTLPQLRAGTAAASFFTGGMLALCAFAGVGKLRKNKSVGIGFGLFLCLVGIAAAFPSAPAGFCVDLGQNTITMGRQPGAPVMAFSASSGFYERTHRGYGRHHSDKEYVEATDPNGQELNIIALGSCSEAYDLANALNDFINSQGGQI